MKKNAEVQVLDSTRRSDKQNFEAKKGLMYIKITKGDRWSLNVYKDMPKNLMEFRDLSNSSMSLTGLDDESIFFILYV